MRAFQDPAARSPGPSGARDARVAARHACRGAAPGRSLVRARRSSGRSARGGEARERGGLRVSCLRDSLQTYETNFKRNRALSAYSPLRSLQSVARLFLVSGSATAAAWYSHPHLLNLAAHVLHLDFKDSVTAFQTSFFSFLSLVFAIYSGNTMAFLYDRQKEVVKNLFEECMALEELLEESVNALGPDARDILAQIRLYIEQEILAPENQSPPLGDGHALAAIRAKARNYRRSGTEVADILAASQRLAHAQSTRQASACRLLPPVHWALLYTIGTLFVSTFILFETGGSFSNEGRHILFTTLCGLMSFVLTTLRDLADPTEGVYNGTALLDERLGYIRAMLSKYEKLPVKVGGNTTTLLVGTSITNTAIEEGLEGPAAEGAKEEGKGVGAVLSAAAHTVTETVSNVFHRDSAPEPAAPRGEASPAAALTGRARPAAAEAQAAKSNGAASTGKASSSPAGSKASSSPAASKASSGNGAKPSAGGSPAGVIMGTSAGPPRPAIPGQLAPLQPQPQASSSASAQQPQGPTSSLSQRPLGSVRWEEPQPVMRVTGLGPAPEAPGARGAAVQGPYSRWPKPQGAPWPGPTDSPPSAFSSSRVKQSPRPVPAAAVHGKPPPPAPVIKRAPSLEYKLRLAPQQH